MFEHDSRIPIPVALAIRAVSHNEADADTWALLDAWRREIGDDEAIELILDTIKRNSPDADIERERAWWLQNLIGH